MVQTFDKIIDIVSRAIARDVKQGKNFNMLLGAYNEWQDDECSGMNYIFNINDDADLKYLVDNGMLTATGIAWVVQNCESGLFKFDGEPDAGVQTISIEDVKRILIIDAGEYLPYVIMYAARCGSDSAYAQVYETYVTDVLERSKFNPSNW